MGLLRSALWVGRIRETERERESQGVVTTLLSLVISVAWLSFLLSHRHSVEPGRPGSLRSEDAANDKDPSSFSGGPQKPAGQESNRATEQSETKTRKMSKSYHWARGLIYVFRSSRAAGSGSVAGDWI